MRGFTIFEILIAIAIIFSLAGLGAYFWLDSYNLYSFESEVEKFADALKRARAFSMNNINNKKHGVYILPSGYIVFQGDSFAARDTEWDELIEKNKIISVSGPSEIVFEQLSANISSASNLTINDNSRNKIIYINNEGRIDW